MIPTVERLVVLACVLISGIDRGVVSGFSFGSNNIISTQCEFIFFILCLSLLCVMLYFALEIIMWLPSEELLERI